MSGWSQDPCLGDAGWAGDAAPPAGWGGDPCLGEGGWGGELVCRRPYDVGAYGRGPYGRCAIVGGGLWGEEAPTPSPFAPPTPSPWGKARHG